MLRLVFFHLNILEFLIKIFSKLLHFANEFFLSCCSFEGVCHCHKCLVIKICHFIHHHFLCPQIDAQCSFFSTIPQRKHYGFCLLRTFRTTVGCTPFNVFRNPVVIQLHIDHYARFCHVKKLGSEDRERRVACE